MNSELVEAARARNKELAEDLVKSAFVGRLAGKAGNAALDVGKGLLRGSKKHPLAAGFAYVSLAPKAVNPVPALRWPMGPRVEAQRKATKNTARQVLENKQLYGKIDSAGTRRVTMRKVASIFSREEIEQTQRIADRLEKTAAMPKVLNKLSPELLKQMGMIGAVGLGLGAGTQLGSYGISKMVARGRTRNEKKHYGAMIKADPGLRREPGAREMFNIVNRASPYLASEPTIAAATVRSMLDSPALDERKLQQLLTTEKLRQETEFPWRASGKESTLRDVATMAALGV
ncbi:MAG: hypothetical protein VXZ72_01015 [Chlamydiota bacterium]|nr:hypothetical protein [Chlamydiota bacterium]